MNTTATIKALKGYKTYIFGSILILYLFGAKADWWPFDTQIALLIATLGGFALRAGVKSAEVAANQFIATLEQLEDPPRGAALPPIDKNGFKTSVGLVFAPLIALALLLQTGCATAPTTSQVSRMASIAELAAFTGASIDLSDNPDHAVFYEASEAALSAMLQDHNYDPEAFAAALQKLPVNELKSDKGAIIVGAAVILWDQYASEVVNLDKGQFIAPVIGAVRDGLRRALARFQAATIEAPHESGYTTWEVVPNPYGSYELRLVSVPL